ncbi:protein kinase family protein [Ornithinibacillus halophilus]|uniref:Spore coat protein YutH n=1 Tax=Ornithinibacillus halophilus TaxID=930117 RepID=A0A1M5JPY4_9BACI|nr:hypothetical protein [Ornithinibacillus halophilus]SHG42339.1 spore coat protein YutH [Ornithinibacillus halophilus]
MKEFLKMNYGIQVKNKVRYRQLEGFQDDEHLYFIIPSLNKETIHMEQAALGYFLAENSYDQIAYPLTSLNGEWFQMIENTPYIVTKVETPLDSKPSSHGTYLANFHQLSTTYQYEPQEISSYGQWKDLWISKLTAFEQKTQEEAAEYRNDYYRLVMDSLPYLVGVSENAIQYLQETESERRYHLHDQGTIAFRRYQNNVEQPIIWFHDLVYDHPTRDLAEFIRYQLLSDSKNGLNNSKQFIQDYQSIRPLSVFSWRLLYARLIFPIHIFDCLEDTFIHRDFEKQYKQLQSILDQQHDYELNLSKFFEMMEVDYQSLRIPVLHWL